MNSDVNLIWRHTHRHAQNHVPSNVWAPLGPIKLTQTVVTTDYKAPQERGAPDFYRSDLGALQLDKSY